MLTHTPHIPDVLWNDTTFHTLIYLYVNCSIISIPYLVLSVWVTCKLINYMQIPYGVCIHVSLGLTSTYSKFLISLIQYEQQMEIEIYNFYYNYSYEFH